MIKHTDGCLPPKDCFLSWTLKIKNCLMPNLSLMAPKVVITITSGATSDNKVGIMTTHGFMCILRKLMYSDWSQTGVSIVDVDWH